VWSLRQVDGLAKTDGFLGLNELDPLDPFDHLVAKLVLDPEPQRSPIYLGERLSIHLGSEQAFCLEHVCEALRVIIGAPYNDPPNE
jgi:hypothetical protein